MSKRGNNADESDKNNQNRSSGDGAKNNSNKRRQRNSRKKTNNAAKHPSRNSVSRMKTATTTSTNAANAYSISSAREEELLHRITQLECLVANQAVEMRKLKDNCKKLADSAEAFGEVIGLLRQAGLTLDESKTGDTNASGASDPTRNSSKKEGGDEISESGVEQVTKIEAFDDTEIFGTAPSSVTDAADTAGASILAALLGGKQRMLVDVRDAELSRDLDVLVQFIELSILPVAAGLEGLKTQKNRVKIVFPTVSLLMQYRRTMALAAPEVISLSTLGFDPVEKKDNLVVVIAPFPDDDEGLAQMNDLLSSPSLRQPVVVLNHHMVPLLGPGGNFEPVYHLRLLSVQYMTGDSPPLEIEKRNTQKKAGSTSSGPNEKCKEDTRSLTEFSAANTKTEGSDEGVPEKEVKEDAELEAAMEHAHELGVQQGVTRAMVIRAYPKPWHVFVDTSPDSDADFEVAATFDEYPSQDDINFAIVECLEGSEREDELVAQQMQQALESGQLNTVSDMLGITNIEVDMNPEDDDEEDEDEYYDDWNPWGPTDTV